MKIKPESKLYRIKDEIQELARSGYELDSLIKDTDPQPRIDALDVEIAKLQQKRNDVIEHFDRDEQKTDKLIIRRTQTQKRLQLLRHRKRVNELLSLAKKMKT